ncbi:helix-turn-helix domain-containing protein [Microbacterium sp. Leaf179]|uniref:helix-turn-helix domain-containing protein n=1 Tax=Microbacterium sp. Leaf179 TaxID=1736288 RepID=UPI00228592F7|nr:recombinase family protein [Microbacterium sp. Leaf179]
MLAAFAEFERALIRERQAEGIRIAKAEGPYRGRARKLTPVLLDEARQLISAGIPKAEVARRYGVDRSTLHRALVRSAAE